MELSVCFIALQKIDEFKLTVGNLVKFMYDKNDRK